MHSKFSRASLALLQLLLLAAPLVVRGTSYAPSTCESCSGPKLPNTPYTDGDGWGSWDWRAPLRDMDAYDRVLAIMHRPEGSTRTLPQLYVALQNVHSFLHWDRLWVRCRYEPAWKEGCAEILAHHGTKVSSEAHGIAQSSSWYNEFLKMAVKADPLQSEWILDSVNPDFPLPKDQYGRTLLLRAVDRQNLPLARALISGGADLLARDSVGNTAVHLAVRHQLTSLLSEMMKQRPAAVVEALRTQNAFGVTPVQNALALGNPEIIRLFGITEEQVKEHARKSNRDHPPRRASRATVSTTVLPVASRSVAAPVVPNVQAAASAPQPQQRHSWLRQCFCLR